MNQASSAVHDCWARAAALDFHVAGKFEGDINVTARPSALAIALYELARRS